MRAVGPHRRLPPTLFGIPLGMAGLAQCWTTAHDLGTAPAWPAAALWVLVALVWAVLAGAWYARHHRPADLARALADPTSGPFVAVSAVVPLTLGGALARVHPTAGQVVFVVALVATLLLGGWLTGQWMVSDTTLAQWHPGYFLPTVGGGLVAATVAAGLGERSLARVLFGYGAVCWIVLGSIILARLFTQPPLAVPLRPTLAVELAPPVVAGLAWFRIDGGRVDAFALGLAGYALLMALVQVRLVPTYRTVPFGPGWWAFSFPYAATVTWAIAWLAAEHATGTRVWTWALLVLVTTAAAVLVGRTLVALRQGRFLPALPPPLAPDVAPDVVSTVASSAGRRHDGSGVA